MNSQATFILKKIYFDIQIERKRSTFNIIHLPQNISRSQSLNRSKREKHDPLNQNVFLASRLARNLRRKFPSIFKTSPHRSSSDNLSPRTPQKSELLAAIRHPVTKTRARHLVKRLFIK